jgi:hypothetical protein
MKLRSHLNSRAETCFSIQAFTPHARPPSRRPPPSRYETARPAQEEALTHLENINLDEFVHAILAREKREEGERAQEFMRSLNGTWFQGNNEHFKCAKIYNTLGIKKSRSVVRPRSERYSPELLRERVDFTREFRQNGLFPSRKASSYNVKKLAKSPTATPAAHHVASPTKNCEGSLKYQIVKTIKSELEGRTSRGSIRPGKNIQTVAGTPFYNEKLAGKNRQAMVTGKKMLIHE